MPWHALAAADVFQELDSSENGLSVSEAAARLLADGPNVLPEPPGRTILWVVLDQLKSPLIYLLVAAAVVSVALAEWDDAVFIVLVLAINTTIGAVQEWRAQEHTAALRSVIRTTARVLRDGILRSLDGAALVVGDIVHLEAGNRVPADVRLIRAAEIEADESSMTGESLPVEKDANAPGDVSTVLADRKTMLFAGTVVQRGHCVALVVGTGSGTEIGRLAQTLVSPSAVPPLTRRLERLTRLLGIAALVMVAAVVALRLVGGAPLRDTFFLATALAVSIIPEGLPVAVTVALSIATRRMARRNVIIRSLPAVEGLGACTVIATDKTGTLTLNRLTAKRLWLPGHGVVDVAGEGFDVAGGFSLASDPASESALAAIRTLGLTSALCNDASFEPDLGEQSATGDMVDIAFLVLAAKAGIDVRELRRLSLRVSEIPFSAERKFAATRNRHGDGDHLHVKGAAEVVIPLCLGDVQTEAVNVANEMATAGYRVLAIATKRFHRSDSEPLAEILSEGLRDLDFLGLVGFMDPLRPEAKEAVSLCRRAGVAVKMVTGDHAATALTIARQLGIAETPDDVVTGYELASFPGDGPEVAALVHRASVFARVEPSQKVQIVEALQAGGDVVAVTGDGVNDAPALHRADLGVAMGLGGTDVARDAADLVLTDDNFASVVAGIEEGRAAYANIRKVVYLLISTGVAEVVVFLLALLTGLPVPLTAIQLLWLNLVTNGGQDVALAFEHREPGLLDRPPRGANEPIFDRLMMRETAISGAYMGLVAYAVFAIALAQGLDEFDARNVLLFLMVAFENVHVFNCRSESVSAFRVPLSKNWPLLAAVVAAQSVHVAAAFIPGIRDVLRVAPISFELWLLLFPIAGSVLLVMEVDKALRQRSLSRSR